MSFISTFGGSSVSTSEVAYAAYSFSASFTSYWPAFSNNNPNICARFMNLTATAGSLNFILPDATLTSVGQDVIVFNAGSVAFNVVTNANGAIVTVSPGIAYYLLLEDNTTQGGTWSVVQFGAGTSSAVASALAGAGLKASGGLLNVVLDVISRGGDYTITSGDLAVLQSWTAGTGTITLPAATTVGDGFFFPFSNNGSGTVTISGPDLIDGAASSIFNQAQSAFIITSGGAWYTVGKGTLTNFTVTVLNLNVGGNSDVTETSIQAQNIIQQFTGTLTGSINVIVPNTAQIYYTTNSTSGSFTLTFKTAAGTGVALPQGASLIVYCDGTNVVNAITGFSGSISIGNGTAAAPKLSFISSPSTGIYSPSGNQLAITAFGKEAWNFTAAGSAVNYLQSAATATGNAVSISALGSDTNISFNLVPKGSGALNLPATASYSGSTWNGVTLGVGVGGTGQTSLTQYSVLLGNGISAISSVPVGTAGRMFLDQGAGNPPAYAAMSGDAALTGAGGFTINNGVVSNSKLATMTGNSIKGNGTNVTAAAADLAISNNQVLATISNVTGSATLSAVIDAAIGSTQGNVLYRNASNWAVLAPGTASTALLTGGGGANPAWGIPLMTALGVGSIICGSSISSTAYNAGDSAAAADISPRYTTGAGGATDTIAGTWRALQTNSGGNITLWQRIA